MSRLIFKKKTFFLKMRGLCIKMTRLTRSIIVFVKHAMYVNCEKTFNVLDLRQLNSGMFVLGREIIGETTLFL